MSATPDPLAGAITQLCDLMVTLRAECPWDRVQTHATLRRHLLEEAYEVLEVLDRLDGDATPARDAAYVDLREELGDLVFQVVFHAHLAAEAGQFDLASVLHGVHDKLVARHPQIFDPETASDTEDWETAKVREKGRDSVLDGIPATLPALAMTTKLIAKARAVDPTLVASLLADPTIAATEPVGTALFGLAVDAKANSQDAESSLRRVNAVLAERIRAQERALQAGAPIGDASAQ